MRISEFRFMLTLFGMVAAGAASAETFTNQQLIATLGQVSEGAPSIDAALLIVEVAANVGKGSDALPTWSRLAAMPQINVDIEFELNSVAISPESYRNVGLIADALHDPRLLGHKILIVGHTDSTGDAKHNLKLSAARADAIRDALSTTFAVAPDRLFAVGVGEEMPLNVADPKAAANRRVQLINVGLLK